MPSVGTSRQEKRKGRGRGLQLRNLRRPALANRHLDFPEYRQSGGFYYCALTWGLSIISIVSGRSPLQRRPHDTAPAISPFLVGILPRSTLQYSCFHTPPHCSARVPLPIHELRLFVFLGSSTHNIRESRLLVGRPSPSDFSLLLNRVPAAPPSPAWRPANPPGVTPREPPRTAGTC